MSGGIGPAQGQAVQGSSHAQMPQAGQSGMQMPTQGQPVSAGQSYQGMQRNPFAGQQMGNQMQQPMPAQQAIPWNGGQSIQQLMAQQAATQQQTSQAAAQQQQLAQQQYQYKGGD